MTAATVPLPLPPEAVLEHIPEAADIIVPIANGEPVLLMDTLEANNERLSGVRVHQMHPLRPRDYIRGAFGDRLRHVSYFLAAGDREAFWAGQCDLVPNHFSEVPALLRKTTKCSLVMAAASPPDRHGYFSLGTNADYVASMVGRVPFFLEASHGMPRTIGGTLIHASQVAGWCESDHPLSAVPPAVPGPSDKAIAALIAERVPNGATIQIGVGGIPNAVLANLSGHENLGLHTELLSDGVIDLVEGGVLTGTHKRHRRNKHVATFCLGTQGLYDWLDGNEGIEVLGVDWVNNPMLIGDEPNFVSINATAEIDLMGQCASETIAGRYWSSSGGQADFARGAMYSEGGQAFLVLHSQTSKGRSRVRTQLTPGSVVTTLKNTVDHVVTEHGIAELRGLSLRQRAAALIAIAHPDHRDELTREARESGLLR